MSKRIMFLLAALLGFALVASACGSDSDDASSSSSASSSATAEEEAAPETTEAAAEETAEEEAASRGDITMCRANWASGYIQAEIVRQIMQTAGYTVSDPSEIEL
ncbi:MAG: hypothetical protein VYC89_00420, partial [Actinomycetota bacterium]|nr:hypothetical protein [Actinomycetota bacterium]